MTEGTVCKPSYFRRDKQNL